MLEAGRSVRQVLDLADRDFDLFFNLCDGAWDENRPGIEVVRTLEMLDVPFTGATSAFFEPPREAMKRVCAAWGIDTPRYAFVHEERDLERALDTLRFPMIVKHPSSYSSLGITRASRVTDADALRALARSMLQRYRGALVEEFIDGGEATVLVAENPDELARPVAYVPVQYRFPEGESFKHYDLKWSEYHGLVAEPVGDPVLAAALQRMSADFFVGLDGAGYARCDLRLDVEGRPYMLEINPNPGVFYELDDPGSADLILAHSPGGHPAFVRQVIDAALARHRRARPAWQVLPRKDGGYGLFATRAVEAGETLIAFEETPHELVTLSHVERSWGERERDWFDRYAWPLTDEIWVTWSRDPMAWKPVNHGCDPSAWVEGLDVVARRALAAGEEITLDYATMYGERMPSFACACGSRTCRGVIRGTDHLEDFVARYGEHVTDWVRRKRQSAEVAAGDPA